MFWLSFFIIYHLILCEYLFRSVKASGRVKRTSSGRFLVCPSGCLACSETNGCVKCEARMYMQLERLNGTREYGQCVRTCKDGYYGVRNFFYSMCHRCHIEHCAKCFSRHFCTLCNDPYLVHEGECLEACPAGLYYANYTRECTDRVDCLPGPWSPWALCTRNGQTCGFRWGSQTRAREILQNSSPNGTPCPEVTESRRCRLQRRQCDGDCNRRKRLRKKNKNRETLRRKKMKKKRKNSKKKRKRRRKKRRKKKRPLGRIGQGGHRGETEGKGVGTRAPAVRKKKKKKKKKEQRRRFCEGRRKCHRRRRNCGSRHL